MFSNYSKNSYNNFDQIADILLNSTLLIVKDNQYRICEIEFYYKGPGHEDEYTHCDPDQMKCEKFYFHKYKTGTYKSGTFKGLDICLGDINNNIYFGILIRSIYDIKTNIFTEGPCNCVNKILSNYNCTTVGKFMENRNAPLDILDTTNSNPHLLQNTTLIKEEIYKGPRIGLSDKYLSFRDRKYRYVIMINKIKKQKKTLSK